MVLDAADPDSRSAGSFFMNPVVSQEEFAAINQRALTVTSDPMPSFAAPEQNVKLSAAWLIEWAGFKPGHVHDGVGISSKHSLAIINRGEGTASAVLELAERIKTRVLDLYGVSLTPEPIFVGFE